MHLENYLSTILTNNNETFNLAIEIVIVSLLRNYKKKHYLPTSNSYLKTFFKNLK